MGYIGALFDFIRPALFCKDYPNSGIPVLVLDTKSLTEYKLPNENGNVL